MNGNCCSSRRTTSPLSIELFLLSPSRKYSLLPEYCASSPFDSLDNRSSEDWAPKWWSPFHRKFCHFLGVHKFKGIPDDFTSSSLMKLSSKQSWDVFFRTCLAKNLWPTTFQQRILNLKKHIGEHTAHSIKAEKYWCLMFPKAQDSTGAKVPPSPVWCVAYFKM